MVKQLLIFGSVVVEYFLIGDINIVEDSGNFVVNDIQFVEFCCGYFCGIKMSDEYIGVKWCCDLVVNGR